VAEISRPQRHRDSLAVPKNRASHAGRHGERLVRPLDFAEVSWSQNSRRWRVRKCVARHSYVLIFCLIAFGSTASAQSPVPFLNQPLVPSAAVPGSAALTLTVNGSGFVAGSQIDWNGAALPTVFVSATQLTATVPATNLASQISATVTVVNPAPSKGASNPVLFMVTPATANVTTDETDISLPATPAAVITADFNHDGIPDIAVVLSAGTAASNGVAIYLGKGDGSFGAPQTFAVGSDPVALCAADFNGDGKLDLAVVNDQDATVSILLGNGDGTFQAQTTAPTGPNPVSIVAGDFNSDGHIDLAIANTSASVSVLLGKGDGTFTAQPDLGVGSHPIGIATGDFNGDGHLDLAVADAGINVVFILFGNNNGTFTPHRNYATGSTPHAVIAADLNGDGVLDLVTVDENCSVGPCPAGLVSVLLGNSDGTFQGEVSYPAGSTAYQVVVGDFNGDGLIDLATANMQANSASVLLGNGAGIFAAPINIPIAGSPAAMAAADFNSDGRLDLVLASPGSTTSNSSLNVLLQAGVASLSPPSLMFPSENFAVSAPPQSITLSNLGSAALAFSGVSVTGADPNDFSATNNCGPSLPIGATCTITVTFLPQSSGARNASLNVTAGTPLNTTVSTAVLTGTGIAANATLNVSALSFNPQVVSTTGGNQFFTLSSTGNVDLTFGSMIISGANPEDFSATTTCDATVPVGTTCNVFVSFTPSAGGARSAVLTVSDSAPSGTQTVNLSGTGQAFAMALGGSGSKSVAPGQSTSFQLQVTPQGGFNQSVTLSCSGAPVNATCSVSPSTVPMNGSAPASVNVMVVTQAGSVLPTARPGGGPMDGRRGYPVAVVWLLLLCVTAGSLRGGIRSPAAVGRLVALVLVIALCAGLSACIGSSGAGGGGSHMDGTPAGTYTLTVTGKSAPLIQTVTLTLTVQ